MMKYTYLLVNFFTILVPFIFSFHRSIAFHRQWKYFMPAVFIVALLFIAWDSYFSRIGVWSFNPDYTTGIALFNLPLEEWLFFFCIPYACIFTFYCLTKFYRLNWNRKAENSSAAVLCILLLVTGLVYSDRLYTSWALVSTALVVAILHFLVRVSWTGKAFTVYAILLVPFFIVNGVLTGTGLDEAVVIYNDAENTGFRIGTIPVEDIIYGFELFILNLWLFDLNKSYRRHTA